MEREIDFDTHALLRLVERGQQFGLNCYECHERVMQAICSRKPARWKHLSRKYKTYHCYFNDNLSFFVVCKEKVISKKLNITVKTVIIEEGKE